MRLIASHEQSCQPYRRRRTGTTPGSQEQRRRSVRNPMCAGGYENETGIEMGEVSMNELRDIRDATEYLFKQVCRLHGDQVDTEYQFRDEHKHLGRVKSFIGQGLEVLSRLAAEEEALFFTPEDIDRAKHRVADMAESTWYDSKGSSVEYYKDQLFKTAEIVADLADSMGFWNPLRSALNEYKEALSADPDPEGSWEWVPNTHLVAPKMITSVMCAAGQNAAEDKIDCVEVGQIYRAILAARPPVPKKGESV